MTITTRTPPNPEPTQQAQRAVRTPAAAEIPNAIDHPSGISPNLSQKAHAHATQLRMYTCRRRRP